MSLFKIGDISIPPIPSKHRTDHSAAIQVDAREHRAVLARDIKRSALAELIPAVSPGSCWHVVGAGRWSNFDLVAHLATLAAPAELWISTWGISDPGVRAVERMLSDGHVTEVHAVLDGHTAVQHSGATAFLRDLSKRLGVLPCHAKAYILRGPRLNISVITSANLTNNPYLEAGTIVESREVADFHVNWIDLAIRRATPFEGEDDKKGE